MILGFVAIVIACFEKVPLIIVKPLELLIELQNNLIKWIASFEDFVFTNISFTSTILWASYLIIIAIFLCYKNPDFKRTATVLISIIVLQTVSIGTKFKTNHTQELIVFHARKNTIMVQRQNESVIVYSNDSILNTLHHNLSIQSYLVGNFCEVKKKMKLQNLFYFKEKKILLIDSFAIYSEKIKPDILIITHSPKLNLERLLYVCKPKEIIADASNFKSYVRLWEATCKKEKIPFHYTNEKGFYKI
jgi:competence protein ComEC